MVLVGRDGAASCAVGNPATGGSASAHLPSPAILVSHQNSCRHQKHRGLSATHFLFALRFLFASPFFPFPLSQLARCAHLTRQWRRAADPASTYPRPPTRLFWSRRCGERGVLCGVELPGFSQSRRSACAAKTLRPTFEADIITLETVVRALRRWGPATQCLGKLLNS